MQLLSLRHDAIERDKFAFDTTNFIFGDDPYNESLLSDIVHKNSLYFYDQNHLIYFAAVRWSFVSWRRLPVWSIRVALRYEILVQRNMWGVPKWLPRLQQRHLSKCMMTNWLRICHMIYCSVLASIKLYSMTNISNKLSVLTKNEGSNAIKEPTNQIKVEEIIDQRKRGYENII